MAGLPPTSLQAGPGGAHQIPEHRATPGKFTSYAFGGVAILFGLWQLLAPPKEATRITTYPPCRVMFIMVVAFIVKWDSTR